MSKKLSKKELVEILDFYKNKNAKNKNGSKTYKRKAKLESKTKLESKVERLLMDKFCSCIKRVSRDEDRSIPICKKSVFHNKGLTIGRFSCKKSGNSKKRNSTIRKRY